MHTLDTISDREDRTNILIAIQYGVSTNFQAALFRILCHISAKDRLER